MSGRQLVQWTRAEALKLMSRRAARLGLIVSAMLGLVGPLLVLAANGMEMNVNESSLVDWLGLRLEPTEGQLAALRLRNALPLPLFVMWLSASSFAGEYRNHTLREDLLRPVPRTAVLSAKWFALVLWVALSVAACWLTSAVLGTCLFGLEGQWTTLSLGYLATIASEATLAALALCVAVFLRSVPATLVGLFLGWAISVVTGWALGIANAVLSSSMSENLGVDEPTIWLLQTAHRWLPSQALWAWGGCRENIPWLWEHFASMACTLAVCALLSARRFGRTDVP